MRVPEIVSASSSGLNALPASDSALVFEDQLRSMPLTTPEHCQTSYSPPSPANTPLSEGSHDFRGAGRKLSPFFGLQVPSFRITERPLERWDDLTPRGGDYPPELEPHRAASSQNHDIHATPRKSQSQDATKRRASNAKTPSFVPVKPPANDAQPVQVVRDDRAQERSACDTCQAVDQLQTRTRMAPCGVSPHLSDSIGLLTDRIPSISLASRALQLVSTSSAPTERRLDARAATKWFWTSHLDTRQLGFLFKTFNLKRMIFHS